jgi:hypothetical protein
LRIAEMFTWRASGLLPAGPIIAKTRQGAIGTKKVLPMIALISENDSSSVAQAWPPLT